MADVYELEKERIADRDAALKYAFYCIDYLRYTDIFKNECIIGFYAKLNAFTGWFYLIGDERFNYMREVSRP